MNDVHLHPKLVFLSDYWSSKFVEIAGKKRLSTLLPLCALFFAISCNSKQGATCSQAEQIGDAQRISIGMPLEEALVILKSHHAKETGFQVVSSDPNDHLRFFDLPNGRTLEIVSAADSDSRQTIKGMFISTYQPKSWTSKQDPERSKFFESFRQVQHYDMIDQPKD